MKILRAEEKHIDAMLDLERACFSRPWSRQGIEYEVKSPDAAVAAAMDGDNLIGFAIVHRVADEGELFNIAVNPNHRGKGIGRELLACVTDKARLLGARRLYREVRRSNESALALYRGAGWQVCGVRKNYYEAPAEDAILMEVEL